MMSIHSAINKEDFHKADTEDYFSYTNKNLFQTGMTRKIFQTSSDSNDKINKKLSHYLNIGSNLTFRIAVLQAINVPDSYADIFCQFQ